MHSNTTNLYVENTVCQPLQNLLKGEGLHVHRSKISKENGARGENRSGKESRRKMVSVLKF